MFRIQKFTTLISVTLSEDSFDTQYVSRDAPYLKATRPMGINERNNPTSYFATML
jgi:hypothetical protein